MGARRERVLLRIGTLTSFFATPSPKETWLFGGRTTVMPHRVSRTFQARRALLRYLASRYQRASPAQKTLLLDSFVEWTGYTRKYAIELLNHGEYDQPTIQRRRLPSTVKKCSRPSFWPGKRPTTCVPNGSCRSYPA